MFRKSENANENYVASIVKIDEFRPHSNADRLKIATVFFNNVITGIDAPPGLYVYFPIESALSVEFLAYTNSFRDKEMNFNKEKAGMFESHGRVKAVRLRGEKSEGYIISASVLEDFVKNVLYKNLTVTEKDVGIDFDSVGDHLLCKKYIPRNTRQPGEPGKKTKGDIKKYISRLVENQFHFHESTAHLKKCIGNISPEDYISVTAKFHGCNSIISHVLTKRQLSFWEKLAKKFGVKVQESEYGMLYSSRTVIKNDRLVPKNHNHFYGEDVWKIAADTIFPKLRPGISVIGEIVGYASTGGMIQKNYDYGCSPGQQKFYAFKMTYTSPNGNVYVFGHREMVKYCQEFDIPMVPTYFYGKAKDMYPDLDIENHWHENFLQKLTDDYLEKKCAICKNDVWDEGIVLRKEVPHEWEAYKLKSFNFVQQETKTLDRGEIDMETLEADI